MSSEPSDEDRSDEKNRGALFTNLLLFGRLLRGLGLDVDTGRMIDLVHALRYVDIGSKADFFHTMRCLLVHRREDLPLFEKAFELYWRKPSEGWKSMQVRSVGSIRRTKPLIVPVPLRLPNMDPNQPARQDHEQDDEPPIVQATFTYSDREILRRKDFAELNEEEMESIRRLLADFIWQFGRRTRRFRPGNSRTFDLRRTFRQNIRYGGEILEWARMEPKVKSRPLVILADISGSMERYTRILLYFAYTLSRGFKHGGETFVFSTRLTKITRLLRERNVDLALWQISRSVPDWSGGTRIGDALKTFNCDWARRVLGHGAVVLLISDGWDRGDPAVLREEIARLQRSCYRLIWLNPLLGSENYEPLTRGMQTALPYIDDFLPVHNLASLEDLAVHLQKIEVNSPVRRQFYQPVKE